MRPLYYAKFGEKNVKIHIQKFRNNEKLFFVAYTIYMIIFILNHTFYWKYFPEKADRYALLVCVVVLAMNELISVSKINFRTMFGLIICLSLFIITYSTNGNAVAGMIVFVYCARNISFEKISKYTVLITSVMVGFVVLSSWIGIIDDFIEYGENRIRHYLGFRYSLYSSALIFNITLLIIYSKNIYIKYREILMLFMINYFVFYFTNSRLSFVLSMVSLGVAIIYKKFYAYLQKKQLIYNLLVLSYLLCAVVFYGLTVTYSSGVQWKKAINDFLGGRLLLGQTSLFQYGVTLFGQQIPWVGNGLGVDGTRTPGAYLWVDCLYIQVLQRYGIVFLILFLAILTLAMYHCYKQKKFLLMIMLSLVALHCMIDDLQLYLQYNTFWFAIGMVLLERISKKNNQSENSR